VVPTGISGGQVIVKSDKEMVVFPLTGGAPTKAERRAAQPGTKGLMRIQLGQRVG
jgi:hypothetical protein